MSGSREDPCSGLFTIVMSLKILLFLDFMLSSEQNVQSREYLSTSPFGFEAHANLFRLLVKGIFDVNVL